MEAMDVEDEEALGAVGTVGREQERAEVRAGYRRLNEEICRQEDGLLNTENLQNLIQTNEQLYDKVAEVQEAVTDAKIIRNISRLCKNQTDEMSANAVQFRVLEYAERLVRKMKGVVREDGKVRISRRKLVLLGTEAKPLFNRSPALSYLFGALAVAPPQRKEKKQREVKAKPTKELVSTQATVLKKAESSGTQTEQMVVHTFTCLVTRFKENNRKPVNYFRFVTDPSCFGRTVENMFHVSFLVKEGKARIQLEEGVPVIRPVKPRRAAETTAGREDEARNQVVVNISMYDWERIVQKLQLKESMIPSLTTDTDDPDDPQPGPSSRH